MVNSDKAESQTRTVRDFPLHDELSAPAVAASLTELRQRLGYVPNWARALANSPRAFDAFTALNLQVARSRLSVAEKQTIMLTISRLNECHYCMAAHSASASRQRLDPDLIEALRQGTSLPDPRLRALQDFAAAIYIGRGSISDRQFQAFMAAGFTREQSLEVVLAISTKVLSNFADKLMGVELDEVDRPYAWPTQEAASLEGERADAQSELAPSMPV